MTTLLRLDASLRAEGSYSRAIADDLEAAWRGAHPGGRVVVRDLALDPPPHLDARALAAQATTGAPAAALSDALIAELAGATDLLISTPLYNFGVPSALKAWFDRVVRAGHTFETRSGRYQPLLRGRVAYVVAARGGVPGMPGGEDLQLPYLRAALRFLGWPFVEVVEIPGTSTDDGAAALAAARGALRALFPTAPAPTDDARPEDRAAIAALSAAQARAIVAGDPEGYAQLCTDDICLLLPGRRAVHGQADFLAAERAMLRGAPVRRFDKRPTWVTIAGDLAIEVGVQRVESAEPGVGPYAPAQKYLHVLRRSPAGWRFAVLMSNPSE